MHRDAAVSSAMAARALDEVADEQNLAAALCQSKALSTTSPSVYRTATFTTAGAPDGPVRTPPSINVIVQARDTTSLLALLAEGLMVASPPVNVQKTNAVREVPGEVEVVLGPGLTLGYLSLDEYKFTTNLRVIED